MSSTSSSRPKGLPEFRQPPLNEVLVGVQFSPAPGYQPIQAWEVWELYRAGFPSVEIYPPLPPIYEIFGRPGADPAHQTHQAQPFGFFANLPHPRYWFLAANQQELIQFQPDRLLHNWRKFGARPEEYPRFEGMIDRFAAELQALDGYFSALGAPPLRCNQAEIAYINHIPLTQEGQPTVAGGWLRFIDFSGREPDDVATSYRRILHDHEGAPQGRLICEMASAGDAHGEKMLVLTLTARGTPSGMDIASALEFLRRGRLEIVTEFAAITTDEAHRAWERVP